jgi:hypothetical protein
VAVVNDLALPATADVIVSSPRTQPAASWPAIAAGAFVAVSASLILMAVGSGVGLESFSAWSSAGAAVKALTINAAIWLIVTQWMSAALGGYIAGRLRSRWHGTHDHEVFFRDTAHGLITWSVATVFVVAVLTSTLSSAVGFGAHATLAAASGASVSAEEAYATDVLFRPAAAASSSPAASSPAASSAAMSSPAEASPRADSLPRAELQHMLANAATTGHFPDADRSYLADLVARRTGIPAAEAQKRVDDFIANAQASETQARAAAETARKDAAEASLYIALSLLIGAFIASVSAALGGRLRDLHP